MRYTAGNAFASHFSIIAFGRHFSKQQSKEPEVVATSGSSFYPHPVGTLGPHAGGPAGISPHPLRAAERTYAISSSSKSIQYALLRWSWQGCHNMERSACVAWQPQRQVTCSVSVRSSSFGAPIIESSAGREIGIVVMLRPIPASR